MDDGAQAGEGAVGLTALTVALAVLLSLAGVGLVLVAVFLIQLTAGL